MGYTVFHITKGKVSGGLGLHIDRTGEKKHSYPHADENRKDLNKEISIHKDKDMFQAINEVIENRGENEGLEKPKTVRKDAVRFLETIFSGSNSDMKEIEKSGKIDEWYKDNYEFAKELYGEENIVRFALHRDEETAHIHCVSVPITSDGKLSAKKVMGNAVELRNKHNSYAEAMKKWGLKRGELGSNQKHDDRDSYMKRVAKADDKFKTLEEKNWLGLDKNKTIEALKGALKAEIAMTIKVQDNLNEEVRKEELRVMHMMDSFEKMKREGKEKDQKIEKIFKALTTGEGKEEVAKMVTDYKIQQKEKDQEQRRGFRGR